MGSKFSRMWKKLFSKKEAKVLMLGLDSAGKTTILYRLKLGLTLETIPTMGFVYEKIQHKKFVLNVWDVAGQDTLRPLWRQYFQGSKAIIFVVDSSDTDRLGLAKQELHGILNDETIGDAIILLVANKIDLGIMEKEEVEAEMDLGRFQHRTIKSFGVVGTTGEGLPELMEWLGDNLGKKKKKKKKK